MGFNFPYIQLSTVGVDASAAGSSSLGIEDSTTLGINIHFKHIIFLYWIRNKCRTGDISFDRRCAFFLHNTTGVFNLDIWIVSQILIAS